MCGGLNHQTMNKTPTKPSKSSLPAFHPPPSWLLPGPPSTSATSTRPAWASSEPSCGASRKTASRACGWAMRAWEKDGGARGFKGSHAFWRFLSTGFQNVWHLLLFFLPFFYFSKGQGPFGPMTIAYNSNRNIWRLFVMCIQWGGSVVYFLRPGCFQKDWWRGDQARPSRESFCHWTAASALSHESS